MSPLSPPRKKKLQVLRMVVGALGVSAAWVLYETIVYFNELSTVVPGVDEEDVLRFASML